MKIVHQQLLLQEHLTACHQSVVISLLNAQMMVQRYEATQHIYNRLCEDQLQNLHASTTKNA